MDDPMNKTQQQLLEEEIARQQREFGDGDPDAESSKVIEDLDEEAEFISHNPRVTINTEVPDEEYNGGR